MKEIGVSWKLPPCEMSCKDIREIFPHWKNHVYSNVKNKWYLILMDFEEKN